MNAVNLKDVKPAVHNPRANFDLTFKRKFTLKFGELFPILMQPTIPGDRFRLSAEHMVRFAPFISQVYQDYYISYDYYFVPNRLLWPAFENYMKGVGEHVHPYIDFYAMRSDFTMDETLTTIIDALDIPQEFAMNAAGAANYISALPFGAYMRCILDYHIGTDTPLSQILEKIIAQGYMFNDGDSTNDFVQLYAKILRGDPEAVVPESGKISAALALCSRLYPLDYFTHARSNPQLGPVMTIPLELVNTDANGNQNFTVALPHGTTASNAFIEANSSTEEVSLYYYDSDSSRHTVRINASILNNIASINDFYSAARVQELLSLYGFTGFTSQDALAAEFGVRNKDERVHKAEFIYHDTVNMSIGEVFSNNVNVPSEESGSLTDIAGVGTAIAKGNSGTRGFEYFAPEYGYIVGLMSIYPEASYQQGLPKHFSILDRFDYPHPKLANLGMVDIKLKEIYCDASNGRDYNNTFAYVPPYDNYKNNINRVNGQLKNSLEYLTAGRELQTTPVFNDAFLRVLPSYNDLNRTFNVTSDLPFDQPIFCDVKQNIFAHRQLPKFGLFGNHPTL